MSSDKKWVLCDFDGTLVESGDALLAFFNRFIYGRFTPRKIHESDLEYLKGLSLKEKLRYTGIPFYKVPFLVHACRKNFSSMIDDLEMKRGIVDVFATLKEQGYNLGIISSNNRDNILDYLKARNLTGLFDRVICDRGPFLSVKHRTLRTFIRRNRLQPSDLVYIGDELRDIKACRSAGIPIISVAWGWESRNILDKSNPCKVIDEPHELIPVISSILSDD
ncbi:MAG: HAD-IA family hydrolase [Fibrobacterota bacterium]